MLGGDFGLDAAPRIAVARDDDGALHGDAHALELLVVFRNAVVHVDERRGDVAVDGVRVVGGQLLGLLIRSGILRERRLLQLGGEFRCGLDEFDDALFRRGKEDVEMFDVRVEAPLLKFCERSIRRCPCRTASRRGAGVR